MVGRGDQELNETKMLSMQRLMLVVRRNGLDIEKDLVQLVELVEGVKRIVGEKVEAVERIWRLR